MQFALKEVVNVVGTLAGTAISVESNLRGVWLSASFLVAKLNKPDRRKGLSKAT